MDQRKNWEKNWQVQSAPTKKENTKKLASNKKSIKNDEEWANNWGVEPLETTIKPAGTTGAGFRQLEEASKNPTVGEDLFTKNVLPIKRNDNIAVKSGKGLVNAAVSIADAPFEFARHTAIGGNKALTGGSFWDVPKETSYAQDIIAPALPKKTVKKYTAFNQKHPFLGGASQALIDATDPAMWVGVGGVDKLNPLMRGTARNTGEMLNLHNTPKLTNKPALKAEVIEPEDWANIIPEMQTGPKKVVPDFTVGPLGRTHIGEPRAELPAGKQPLAIEGRTTLPLPSGKQPLALPEGKIPNWEYWQDKTAPTGKPPIELGANYHVDPYGVARNAPGMPLALPEGLPASPSINLRGKLGNMKYPPEKVIKQEMIENNPSIAFKRNPSSLPEIDELNKLTERKIGPFKIGGKVEHVPEAMKRPDMQAADTISKLFGAKGVIPVKGTDNQGMSLGRQIYLNEKTPDPVMYVAKHEVVHTIEATDPKLHNEFINITRSFATDNSAIVKHYTRQGYTPDEVWREFNSDIMSEVMERPDFWNKVRESSPQVIQKVIDVIDQLIAKFKQAVSSDQSMVKYISDLEAYRDTIAPKVGDHLNNMQGERQFVEQFGGKWREPAAKMEGNLNFKLGQGKARSPMDDIKAMIEYGAANARKGDRTSFDNLIRQQFEEQLNGYSPEVQSRILNNLWAHSQQLSKTGKTDIRVGGQMINIAKGAAVGEGQRARSLGISAANSEWASKETAEGLANEIKPGGRGAYDPISNEQTLVEAKEAITQDKDAVIRQILSDKPADRIDNTAGLLLVKEANDSGDIALAVDLTESLAKKATEAGQAIQALSMWGRLTPEGMLSYAQKVVKNTNNDLARTGNKKRIKLSEADAKKIIDIMKQADGMEGRAKEIKTAQALDLIAAQIPVSWGRRIATIQTMAQLLNPKTATRNIVGNVGFAGMENISDVVGTGLDKATGLLTGNRTKVLPSLATQGKGAQQGFKLGLEDALMGIDTSAMKGGKFDIPQTRTFRSGPLSKLETAMNIELRATDRAFYQAAYDESLRQQTAAAAKSKKPPTTEQMEEIAHYDGLYRTFQDDSAAAYAFTRIKRALNLGKDFGAGDFIIKYPKTPGNLLSRGIEYSPAGFIKTIMEMGKPLFGKEFNQKAFVEATSRALVGSTMLVGAGALMHKLGLITGSPDRDYDIENLKAQAGFGQYKLNASGLKRFIASGFDPNEAKLRKGDITLSYDWFQPNSIGLAMGADIDKNKGEKRGVVGKLGAALTFGAGGLMAGINSFAEQPVMQGVQQLFSGQDDDLAAGALKTLEGVPASFMPTLLNQVKQLMDNQKRLTYSPDYLTEMGNKAKTKIPGAASDLPKAHGTLGQPLPTYQKGENNLTGNNAFNVLVNPAFVSQYKPLPAAERVMDVFNKTGNSEVFPRTVKKYIEFTPRGSDHSQRIDLTPQEYSNYQRMVGEYANEKIGRLSPSLSTRGETKRIINILDDANEKAKKDILKGRGLKAKHN